MRPASVVHMFEQVGTLVALRQLLQVVAGSDLSGEGAADLIDVIGLAEDVKNACAGLQAHSSVVFGAGRAGSPRLGRDPAGARAR